ncbi:hypothetical protein RFN29_25800 [Mesorhizobium sp. VK22B]|uniref:Uncharacterized protein n=1 Tax=Mesorhizobium captivum TaxID=3072319 RepID=A0ABU4Z7V0_9HYPH|nr:hypothetical protein [Mesorhizobium sp. VK22B]MDX8494976.1 hypothetical protein [Mesorhizobium sp. VK22B]
MKITDAIFPLVVFGGLAWLIWYAWKREQARRRAIAYYRKVLEFYKTVHCTEEEDDSEDTLEWKRGYAKLLDWYIAQDPRRGVKEYGLIWRKITATIISSELGAISIAKRKQIGL